MFSWIPESLLRIFFYRDLADLAPASQGLFTGTPMVNSDIFHQIRNHHAEWLRGDILGFSENGIRFSKRSKGVPKGGPGRETFVEGDMVIMATGFQRPSLCFLPEDVFHEPYEPPNRYLQVFPPEHMSICANNCTVSKPFDLRYPANAPFFAVRQCDWHSGKLPYWNIHTLTLNVPGGSSGTAAGILDEEMD